MTTDNKQYSMQDLNMILSDLMHGNSAFQNLVFSRPREAFEYDDLAYTADRNKEAFMNQYMAAITGKPLKRRQAAIASATGIGQLGMSTLEFINKLSPAAGANIVQHFGADNSAKIALDMANSISIARGGRAGGIMSPSILADNMKFAASQGALAYTNNFNTDGSINIEQTHGLSLPVAQMISSKVLSEKSQYTSWAKRLKEKGPGLSKEELEMTNSEIENFKNGVGTTKNAEVSFNKQIKAFTEQINGFVASVSKMTGDYESAISFMQKMTGGNLYTAGEKASKSREKASQLAFNMRIAATDAGFDPRLMYQMADQFTAHGAAAAGFGTQTRLYNRSNYGASLGSLAALGMAKWVAAHPYSTQEDQQRVKFAMEDRTQGYYQGDMTKMNAIAGYLVDTGMISKDDAVKYAKSGDANKMKMMLDSVYGEDSVNRMLSDGKYIESLRYKHQGIIEELDQEAFSAGVSNEASEKGSRSIMNRLKKNLAGEAAFSRQKNLAAIEKELGVSRKDILIQNLSKVGIKDTKTQKEFIKDIEGLSYEESIERLRKYDGNVSDAKNIVDKTFTKKAEKEFGKESEAFKYIKGPKTADEYEKEISNTQKQAYLDTLSELGASEKDLNKKQKIKNLLKDAKNGNWDIDSIRQAARETGINIQALDFMGDRRTAEYIRKDIAHYGGESKALKNFEQGLSGIRGGTDLNGLNIRAYTGKLFDAEDEKLVKMKSDILGEKDVTKRESLMTNFRNTIVKNGLKGDGLYEYRSDSYIENLLTAGLKNKNASKSDVDEAMNGAKNTITEVLSKGGSLDEAFEALKKSKFGGSFREDVFSEKNREEAYEKSRSEEQLAAVAYTLNQSANLGLNKDEMQARMTEVYTKANEYRKQKKFQDKNGTVNENRVAAAALKKVFGNDAGKRDKDGKVIANQERYYSLIEGLSKGSGDLNEVMKNAGYGATISGLKVNNGFLRKKAQEYIKNLRDQAPDKEKFDREFAMTPDIMARIIKDAQKEEQGNIFGMASGGKDAQSYWTMFNVHESDAPLAEAMKSNGIYGYYSAQFLASKDMSSAKRMNKSYASINEKERKRLEDAVHLDDKMKALKETGDKMKKLTNFGGKDIGKFFEDFANRHAEDDDYEFEKNLKDIFNTDADGNKNRAAFEELENLRQQGMSYKEIVTTFAAANGLTGEEADRAQRSNYMMMHLPKATEVSQDREMAGYVADIKEMIEIIKNSGINVKMIN